MSAKRDYYDVLGIDRAADKNTIKKAYRKLAKRSNRSLQCPQRSGKEENV